LENGFSTSFLLTRISSPDNSVGDLREGLFVKSGIYLALAIATVVFAAGEVADAATITDNFAFYDSGNAVIASGSFSYNSAESGVLSYSNLSSFSISLPNSLTYDLSYVSALSPALPPVGNGSYVYFGYDTSSNLFVPVGIPGYAGDLSGILAATDGNTGFFIDPLVGSADPAGTGADGLVVAYNPGPDANTPGDPTIATAFSYSISAVPEQSSWVMMIVGFVGLAMFSARKSFRSANRGYLRT
jgi:hypothetical protein